MMNRLDQVENRNEGANF